MQKTKKPPLLARNGRTLVVVIVARISTDKQDLRSLEDQIAKCRQYIAEFYDGDVEFIVILSQGSGEHLDRKELDELEDRIESRQLDVVIAEDLSRICRRRRAYGFCEQCEDFDTRLIAINDRVDTPRGMLSVSVQTAFRRNITPAPFLRKTVEMPLRLHHNSMEAKCCELESVLTSAVAVPVER